MEEEFRDEGQNLFETSVVGFGVFGVLPQERADLRRAFSFRRGTSWSAVRISTICCERGATSKIAKNYLKIPVPCRFLVIIVFPKRFHGYTVLLFGSFVFCKLWRTLCSEILYKSKSLRKSVERGRARLLNDKLSH